MECPNSNIYDLKGLGKATNLTKLDLTGNYPNNISELSNLSKLTDLSLPANRNSLETAAKLSNLERLTLDNGYLDNLSPLKSLSKLSYLSAKNAGIEDISVLKELPNLREAQLSGNQIKDFSPLKNIAKFDASNQQLPSVESPKADGVENPVKDTDGEPLQLDPAKSKNVKLENGKLSLIDPEQSGTAAFKGNHNGNPFTGEMIILPPPTLQATILSPHSELPEGHAYPGDPVELKGEGFEPGEEITIEFHSTPMPLGQTIAGKDGTFKYDTSVPRNAATGGHHFVAKGRNKSAKTPVTVAPFKRNQGGKNNQNSGKDNTKTGNSNNIGQNGNGKSGKNGSNSAGRNSNHNKGRLSNTGSYSLLVSLLAAGLVASGTGVMVAARRRTE